MYESKDDERCAKRQKVEDDDVSDEGSEQNDEYWANERIFINFPELGDESSYHPEYTHQLFDDERMDFLSEEELGMEVNIDVCLRDWSMKVSIAGLSSNLTKSMLLDGLRNGLPVDVVIAGDRNPISKEQIPSPVGKKVRSFTRNGKSFSIYSARHKDAGAATLLQRGEKLAMYYIETADSVDFGDDRWEVLFLYENNSYVIGTLFAFFYYCVL
ncbi:hypothetical protein EON65_32870 [archaeon]|nr:MAG: hypothetical protein EON65_32870 [archaeon]